MDSIRNSQTVQSIANGPVADQARIEAEETKEQINSLVASRHTPENLTATGQHLTHYHSFFYTLLSWENPRATAASYGTTVLFILAARFFPLSRYLFKAVYTILGITAVAELAGKLILDEGFASRMRPRRYYTIPRETLESLVIDAEELANFFIIEFQRVLFAEDIAITLGVFSSAFVLYYLVKFLPTWGLLLFVTTLVYFIPLAYIQNQEVVDEQLKNLHGIVSEQANQIHDLAAQHTNKAVEISQATFKDYSDKAQGIIGQGKKTAVEKGVISPQTAEKIAPSSSLNGNGNQLPSAPAAEQIAPSSSLNGSRASQAPGAEKIAPLSSLNGSHFPQAPTADLPSFSSQESHSAYAPILIDSDVKPTDLLSS